MNKDNGFGMAMKLIQLNNKRYLFYFLAPNVFQFTRTINEVISYIIRF